MSTVNRARALARRLMHRLSPRRTTRSLRRQSVICEPLESRMLLSAVTVTGIADLVDGDTSSIADLIATPGNDGVITLREAVQAANNTEGADVIEFDQALTGETITLGSAMHILDEVQINGADINFEFGQLIVSFAQQAELKFVSNDITLGAITVDNADLVFRAHGSLSGTSVVNPGLDVSITAYDVIFTDAIKTSGIVPGIDAGNITLLSVGSMQVDQLEADGADNLSPNGIGGDGGNIVLETSGTNASVSVNGAISTNAGNGDQMGGIGGTISITTSGTFSDITLVGGINTDNGNGVTIPDGNNVGGSSSVIPGGGSGSGSVTLEGFGSTGTGGGGTVTVGGQSQPNTAPTANDLTLTAMEDGDTITLAFDATDPDSGDSLTYQLLFNLPYGQLINNHNGTFSYTTDDWQQLNDGMQRDITFTYRVIDNHGAASSPATVTITVEGRDEIAVGANVAPRGVPNLSRTDSNTAININVLDNDHDPDGDLLILTGVDAVSTLGAAVSINSDGTLFYDPSSAFAELSAGQMVRDQFCYTVSDPFGNHDMVWVFVHVTGADEPVVSVAALQHMPMRSHSQLPVIVHETLQAHASTASQLPRSASLLLRSLLSQLGDDDEQVDRLRLMLVDA